MARIAGVPKNKAGLMSRAAYWYARRRLGKVPEPLTLMAHHAWLSRGYVAYEFVLERSHLVDERLKGLASIKVATLVGCPF